MDTNEQISPEWLRQNHFTLRKKRWLRVIGGHLDNTTTLVVEETTLDYDPSSYAVSLKQGSTLIFLAYTRDAEKLWRLMDALMRLC